jgi:hypothetical protein
VTIWDVYSSPSSSAKEEESSPGSLQALYYELTLSCDVALSLEVGPSGVGATAEVASHTLQFALSSGLLQKLFSEALDFQVRNAAPGSHGISRAKVVSVSVQPPVQPAKLIPRSSAPTVSDAYYLIWSTAGTQYSLSSLPIWVVMVMTAVGTVVAMSCFVFVYWCCTRERVKYEQVGVVDADEDYAGAAEPASTTQPVGLARLLGSGRKQRRLSGEDITVVFNEGLHEIEEERPQRV